MSRKPMLIMVLTILLLGLLGVAFKFQKVEAGGTIYIRANGLVEGTDKISNVNNVTYTFTDNINDSIVVERDNIVIDGVGYTLQGIGNGCGLDLSFRSNVTTKNIEIKEFDFGIYFNHSVSNTITGNFLTAINFEGIRLYESSNNNITGNNMAMNDWDAVTVYGSSDNKIADNNFTSNYDGIRLYESSNNSIVENIVANNYYGIFLAVSSNNSIVKNNVTANDGNGISLVWSSNGNRIVENLIMVNKWHGMHLNESSNNIIYHNNFMDNTQQIDTINSVNVWDADYPSGGNYWSDYDGPDSDYDGIGDAPYFIDASNQDNYPLMGMFSSFNTSYGYAVDFVSNSSISYFSFVLGEHIGSVHYPPIPFLIFIVSGETDTHGFLRVCIPKILINDSYVIRFDDEVITNTTYPQVRELPCSNETYEYLYINYTHSEHTIIITGTTIIPEFPSFLILPLFMIATLLAVIAYKRKYH